MKVPHDVMHYSSPINHYTLFKKLRKYSIITEQHKVKFEEYQSDCESFSPVVQIKVTTGAREKQQDNLQKEMDSQVRATDHFFLLIPPD